jgi:hypothetical protein
MTEERKHAILLATVILTARKLQPLLEEDDQAEHGEGVLDRNLHQEVDRTGSAYSGFD